MKISYYIYVAVTSGLFLFLFPILWIYCRLSTRYRKHLKERLGFLPIHKIRHMSGSPRIWVHAASLGEVKVALAITAMLREVVPGFSLIVSTTTEHGRQLAEASFGERVPVIYAPIDFFFSVRKALLTVRPDMMVFIETEIWPAWISETSRMGIKTALINGRISIRSINTYLTFRPFFRHILNNFDLLSMATEVDASRIKAMGADSNNVEINGNAKYDLLEKTSDPGAKDAIKRYLGLDDKERVLVAGSTRRGEETLLLDAFEIILKEHKDAILVLAPRHIERTPLIESEIKSRGMGYHLFSDLNRNGHTRTEKIIIVNSFGDLFNIYSVATVVFCGASLVPLGGQNPLEAAIWGKPVFYGPSMEDFREAKEVLESFGAGMEISDPKALAEKAGRFFAHPDETLRIGRLARKAALKNQGAAKNQAKAIKRLWRSP
ncbi:MAG: glycosyltransferase N-terminal domain-containing protein [Desulfatiglans sp.]|nr:glycosyltransferase N-terminal domain-containing protein [Thermodesulfobacteriota bacterium]MEE4354148.1 glycosyltransferase N-terminal domain-containing protein [Desulfatiglans sp.]